MNIEQAKCIPITEILEKIGCKPAKQNESEAWYISPVRPENTASFHVNKKKNWWYDFGIATGGDSLDLVCRYLDHAGFSSNVPDALRWIKNLFGNTVFPVVAEPGVILKDKSLEIRKITEIKLKSLIQYLEERGISKAVYKDLLKQIRVYNRKSQKLFNAIGLKNESGGYELRNAMFKGCVGIKTVTFVRGTIPKPDGINIFEGFIDYFSVVGRNTANVIQNDTIILNSLACMNIATSYIRNYGYKCAYTWLDNDEAGQKAIKQFDEFFQTEDELTHFPMNSKYAGFKDVNEWHISTLDV